MSLSTGSTSKVLQFTSVALALSILLAPASYAKKASFDMPSCDRMSNSNAASADAMLASPEPVMVIDPASASPNATSAKVGDKLQPLKLTDESKPLKMSKDGKVKLKAERNVKTEPENPADQVGSS